MKYLFDTDHISFIQRSSSQEYANIAAKIAKHSPADFAFTIIEKYEDEKYPMGETTPLSMLLHFMEVRDLKQADLIDVIGSSGVISQIINAKGEISISQAKALAEFFQIDAGLFI